MNLQTHLPNKECYLLCVQMLWIFNMAFHLSFFVMIIHIIYTIYTTAKFFFCKIDLSHICNTHVWHDRIDEEQTPMFDPSKMTISSCNNNNNGKIRRHFNSISKT